MASQEPVFMSGGFQAHVSDMFDKFKGPIEVVMVFFITTLIVFLEKVPIEIRKQADTFLGRALLLTVIVVITILFGWPLGILSTLAAALFIGAGGVHPIVKRMTEGMTEGFAKGMTEGFAPDMNIRMIPDKKKWFIEEVLGENPLMIEDQTVRTSAVQDLTERDSGNVQNSSVTR
jgi:hypothetical protein